MHTHTHTLKFTMVFFFVTVVQMDQAKAASLIRQHSYKHVQDIVNTRAQTKTLSHSLTQLLYSLFWFVSSLQVTVILYIFYQCMYVVSACVNGSRLLNWLRFFFVGVIVVVDGRLLYPFLFVFFCCSHLTDTTHNNYIFTPNSALFNM